MVTKKAAKKPKPKALKKPTKEQREKLVAAKTARLF